MKLAVIQPYFFPYLGYWQLISHANVLALFDDVNYINKGYIDRNYIVNKQEALQLKLQVRKASQNKRINQLLTGDNKPVLAETVRHVYSQAPFFKESYPIISDLILYQQENLALYLENMIRAVCRFLQISTKIVKSSDFPMAYSGKEKIIPLLVETGADTYINPLGGRHLYQPQDFHEAGKSLEFFVPDLSLGGVMSERLDSHASIIHHMMQLRPDLLGELIERGSTERPY